MDKKLLPFALQDVPRYTSYPTAVQFQPIFRLPQPTSGLPAVARGLAFGLCPHPLLPPALLVLRLPHLCPQQL